MEAYAQLETLHKKLYNFAHLHSLADWDIYVNMPPKGEDARGEAIGAVQEHMHELITAPSTMALLDAALNRSDELSASQKANLREMERHWKQESLLPAEFISRKARLTTKAHSIWRESRSANDFQKFLPVLKEIVAIAREEGGYLSAGSNVSPYEALMGNYEPDMTTARLDEVFNNVKTWLPQLLRDIVERRKPIDASAVPLRTPFALDKQEALCRDLMHLMQFDFDAGRLDVSAHPFTGMVKEDCRITTNYDENVLVQSIYGVVHETGHAKYEQNCGPLEMRGQPVCEARSLGIHESQSLFAEFQMGHSDAFVEHLTPKLIQHFGDQPAFTVENMKKLLQHVEPGYIRVEADEVCYPLHVILRYEIERDLISGTLEAEDVPRVWNEKMSEYLGLDTTGKDNLGCLQDVHWAMGSMGYFPTYAIGAMFAAQLMATIKKELGEETVQKCIRNGDLSPIFAKQKEKIWDNGCLYTTEELMIKATGEKLNPLFLRKHLEESTYVERLHDTLPQEWQRKFIEH